MLPVKRLVVGISGASGAAIAVAALRLLADEGVETHLVMSRWGAITLEHETGLRRRQVAELAHTTHGNDNLAAPIASGSYPIDGMLIVPCSARTLGAVATGTGDTLLARAADVCLKERRTLVCALREAPLSAIHLSNALAVSQAGGVIAPLVPAFYARPRSLDELVLDMAGRLVALCGVQTPAAPRWGEDLGLELEAPGS